MGQPAEWPAGRAPHLTLMERRRQGALAEIADVALGLFQRDGFDATTVEMIAATAGCSPRTFYRYFGSKEDVLFHDLPEVLAGLGRVLTDRLAEGVDEWAAVCSSLLDLIARFDGTEEPTATRRMDLWSHEPALRARYLQYVAQAEQIVVDRLCRHRGTEPERDDRAHLIAVATIGAYRATVTTHGRTRSARKLTEHLRESLDLLGAGLAPGRAR